MGFPRELLAAIEVEAEGISHRDLARAVAELTRCYKQDATGMVVIDSAAKLAAYLLVRMPATFAADARVFAEIAALVPDWQPRSLLDLGAGPGTAMWAGVGVFPSIENVTLVEGESRIIKVGERLAGASRSSAIRDATWVKCDLREASAAEADIVVLSYALGELPARDREAVIASAWSCAKDLLLVASPGTPADFATILAVRDQLLAEGAHILAPCPHDGACPMSATRDWCHFAQRLERTSDHRRLKVGELGYEDEKFSYLVASRNALRRAPARIVRHPQKHSGHVQLSLCTNHGLARITVTRSQGEKYRGARKAEWGDCWDEDSVR